MVADHPGQGSRPPAVGDIVMRSEQCGGVCFRNGVMRKRVESCAPLRGGLSGVCRAPRVAQKCGSAACNRGQPRVEISEGARGGKLARAAAAGN